MSHSRIRPFALLPFALASFAWAAALDVRAQSVPDSTSTISMSVNAHSNSDSLNLPGNGTDPTWHSLFASDQDSVQNNLGDTIATTVVTARTRAQVTRKSIAAYSVSTAGAASAQNFYYGLGSLAQATASILNYFRIDHPGLTGQNGTLVASLRVDGAVLLSGGATVPGYTDGRTYAYVWATGLAPVHTCFIGSPLCDDQSIVNSVLSTTEGGPVSGTYELRIPIRFGDVGSIALSLWTRGAATAVAYAGSANMTAESNLLSGVRWNGITEILDANGNPVQGWTIDSPADLATPAPEPATTALLASGVVAITAWSRRRGRGTTR